MVLDVAPEYEPLFEPGGWNWCLTNPEAQRVLRELIVEMHEDFGNPPYFHLGCDEAQPPSCPECRKRPYGELICEHISRLADFVKSRGACAMIWHDMLLDSGDPRWQGFVKSFEFHPCGHTPQAVRFRRMSSSATGSIPTAT